MPTSAANSVAQTIGFRQCEGGHIIFGERGHRFWLAAKCSVSVRAHVCCRNAFDACQLGVGHAVRHRWGFPVGYRLLRSGLVGDQRGDRPTRLRGSVPHREHRECPESTRVPVRLTAGCPRGRLEQRPHRGDTARWHSGVVGRRRWRENRWRRRIPAAVHQSHVPADAGRPAATAPRRPCRVDGPAGTDAAGSPDGTSASSAAGACSSDGTTACPRTADGSSSAAGACSSDGTSAAGRSDGSAPCTGHAAGTDAAGLTSPERRITSAA